MFIRVIFSCERGLLKFLLFNLVIVFRWYIKNEKMQSFILKNTIFAGQGGGGAGKPVSVEGGGGCSIVTLK